MQPNLTCQQCGKRLSKKTARCIEGRVLCSTCMFGPPEKPKTMADFIPGWGEFLDGLASHLEREDPEGWNAMLEAVKASDSDRLPEGEDPSGAECEASQSGGSEASASPNLPDLPDPNETRREAA